MHENNPGGLATKDRTLAYWMDPNNFKQLPPKEKKRKAFLLTFIAGLFVGTIGN